MGKLDNIGLKGLLRKKENNTKDRIPWLITSNGKPPMMRKIIKKHWNVLQINLKLGETFQNNPFVAFKRKKNLQEIMGGHTFKNRKVFKAHKRNRNGKSESCNTSKPPLCCNHLYTPYFTS